MSDDYVAPSNVVSRIGAGVVGGLAGGVVLGAVLQVMGDIKTIGSLVGTRSYTSAWLFLLALCATAGGLYGGLFGRWISRQLVSAIGVGVLYGAIGWVILQLVVIPLKADTRLFAIDDETITLGAYVAFGVALGIVYAVAGPRRRYYAARRWGGSYLYAAMPRRRRRRRDDD
jgi:hypothetical protein